MYTLHPYDSGKNQIDLQYKEDDTETYTLSKIPLPYKDLEENKVIGYAEGNVVNLKLLPSPSGA